MKSRTRPETKAESVVITSTSLARMLPSFRTVPCSATNVPVPGRVARENPWLKVVLSFTATVTEFRTGPCMVNELLAVLTAASVPASSVILPSAVARLDGGREYHRGDHARDLSRNHFQR